ncbi:MAG: hypothetical protein K5879_02735 [Lachnospiraceae bacterium]|nr:hypothetical protein [Lachnospiraceae bacterium]
MAIRFKKFQPTEYVRVIRNGRTVKEGLGLTLLYSDIQTSILLLPATALDASFAFDELITADYQSVFVQGAVTYVIEDFKQAGKMADFSYKWEYGTRFGAALELFNKRINNVINTIVIREIGKKEIRQVIQMADEMAGIILENLRQDETMINLGIRILNINVLGIVAKPETRKALEAAAREEILKEQDDAIYKRRNAAIEQERLIKENELNTEMKVAQKEQEIKERKLEGKLALEEKEKDRRIKMRNTEMEEKIKLEERNKEFVELETENNRKRAEEQAFAAAAMIKAYENANVALIEACALANMDPKTLMAKAFMELGENAGKIGTLNMTPDLLAAIADAGKM